MSVSRRSFLASSPVAFGLASVPLSLGPQAAPSVPPTSPLSLATFPSHPPELARDIVGASHNNIARVRDLLAMHPTLARASWDWGFGDWEDALGAASHVGNREIAELLLVNGARPTIFSAAMLGHLETVKAFIAASPGIESTPGPHSITLLRHAMAGGPGAAAVLDYLKTLPGADRRPASQPITADDLNSLTGDYVFGPGADERIAITVANNALQFTRLGRSGRVLVHVGDKAFYSVGAPLVRIRFTVNAAGARLTVHDPDLVLEATRMR